MVLPILLPLWRRSQQLLKYSSWWKGQLLFQLWPKFKLIGSDDKSVTIYNAMCPCTTDMLIWLWYLNMLIWMIHKYTWHWNIKYLNWGIAVWAIHWDLCAVNLVAKLPLSLSQTLLTLLVLYLKLLSIDWSISICSQSQHRQACNHLF